MMNVIAIFVRMKFLISFLLMFILTPFYANADMIIGGEIVYTVVKGDNIELISSKLGVDKRRIIKENNLDPQKSLQIGFKIKANTKKIVPKIVDNGIVINIPDRTLYYFKDGVLENAFPVGLGMPSWRGITEWRTPTGHFKIISKRKNPTWHVPESMQWKMEKEGKPILTVVPPGPDNPLGRYALDTSIPRVIIHETIWHTSIYQFRSHGCIRVLPEIMERFFGQVKIGSDGEIIYQPIKIAVINNRVYLEVHRDIYGKIKDMKGETKRLLEQRGIINRVNWEKVEEILKEKTGFPEDITQ